MAGDYYRQNTVVTQAEARRLRELALQRGDSQIVLLDPVQDEVWARSSVAMERPSDYFDYFFTGQDIRVRVAEVPETDPQFGELPIAELAWSIEQEKQPIYGFWDYTYSAVMRGTRLVNGAFTIVTKYPGYMRALLGKAAEYRATKNAYIDSYNYPQGLTEDDKNIEQYWGRSLFDPGVSAQGGRHIFSSHPPFSLVITFNLQTTSVPINESASKYQEYYNNFYKDYENNLMLDQNHRIVESDPDYVNRIYIDAIELKSCQQSYNAEGAVIAESYAFFARDIIVPESSKAKETTPTPTTSSATTQSGTPAPVRDPGLVGDAVPIFNLG